MNYNNNSFIDNNNNIIIKQIEKGDIIEEGNQKSKLNNTSTQNNTDNKNDINNNIFSSLPLKIESNFNNSYEVFLTKELLNYNLRNIFNIINNKIIIIKTKIFYILKKNSEKKLKFLLKSEILFLKISSSIHIISSIFKKKSANKLFQVLYKLGGRNKINNIFKIKYEIKFKNEKDNLISENITYLKKLEKDVNEMTDNIKILNLRDNELKLKINNLSKKEKQLNESIKQIESSKSLTNNKNTINSVSESDVISYENTIASFKQQKKEKEKIINNFIFKVNELLNNYQEYIYELNSKGSRNNININSNNSNDISNSNSNSNKPSLNLKEKDESCNGSNSLKASSLKQQSNIF